MKREKEIQLNNPGGSVGCGKKNRAQNNMGVGITVSFLEFLLLMSLSP